MKNIFSANESVKINLFNREKYVFTAESVKKYFSLLNKLIFTDLISENLTEIIISDVSKQIEKDRNSRI